MLKVVGMKQLDVHQDCLQVLLIVTAQIGLLGIEVVPRHDDIVNVDLH